MEKFSHLFYDELDTNLLFIIIIIFYEFDAQSGLTVNTVILLFLVRYYWV